MREPLRHDRTPLGDPSADPTHAEPRRPSPRPPRTPDGAVLPARERETGVREGREEKKKERNKKKPGADLPQPRRQ